MNAEKVETAVKQASGIVFEAGIAIIMIALVAKVVIWVLS